MARLPHADARRLAELAAREGLNTSQAIRLVVAAGLDQLEGRRARTRPPEGG
jgi:hypothetical protein